MKALVVAPPWVGDTVMMQSLLRLIKARHTDATIDVFAIPSLHPLLRRMPEVNRCIASPFKSGDLKIWQRWKFGKTLRAARYTHAYLIPNSLKSTLIPVFAKIPSRIGWVGEKRYFLLNDIRILDKLKCPRAVDLFAALACDKNEDLPPILPLPQLEISKEQIIKAKKRLNISSSAKPILALCPGPEHLPAKRWPPQYFAKIAIAQKQAGWDIWLLGGPKEQKLAHEIQKACNNICFDLTGKTDLSETIDLLSLTDIVIANDSGLMHVASALNKKVIAIYGPTPPEYAPPLTHNKFKMLSLNLNCAPCPSTICHLGHNNCMYLLEPKLVLQSINELVRD